MKYIIRKGKNSSGLRVPIPILFKKKIEYLVKFDSSSIYTSQIPENQEDINKLIGFIEGWDVHYNSARFGWNFLRGKLRLYAYVYNKGVRNSVEISEVPLDRELNLSIELYEDRYHFKVEDVQVEIVRGSRRKSILGWKSYPYFGGNETAPQDITINIREK